MLKDTYGPDSTPFVALEEPEAHLHPAATRALWKAISGMPGQKVVATHSGDLLARVPLANIRRFCPTPNGLRVRQLGPNTLTADDARKVGLHVRATRGELLFARSWLMVEGETEVWVFEGIAEVLGVDLEREGVRIVQYAQVSPEPYIKLADELGIEWFCLADGDPNGQKYKASAVALLNGRVEGDRVLALPESCIETHLCANGHAAIFEASVASQKASRVQASKGTLDYFEQIVDAQPNRGKPARAIECVESMRKQGAASIPKQLREVIVKVVKLAGGNVAP
jgi:putative ATP-dependent endonuclease of OLD family